MAIAFFKKETNVQEGDVLQVYYYIIQKIKRFL